MTKGKGKKMAKKNSDPPSPTGVSPAISMGNGGANGKKKVDFKPDIKVNRPKGGLKPSPSMNTLSRLDRETVVLWKRPFTTLYYSFAEIICLLTEFLLSLLSQRLLLALASATSLLLAYAYSSPGPHQLYVAKIEKYVLWWGYWVFLGILSSIGLGTGLHTFVLYLGPHIAKVTLAAYECGSLNFPEPPYPDSTICSSETPHAISIWDIIAKVRVEAFLWGLGTAIGELPPYFMSRAAALSGQEPDDEEYKEFIELVRARDGNKELGWLDHTKAYIENSVTSLGFFGILACASIPNPFFDLAGLTCGHFLVPFWTFFGATVIGKALIKMHVQMLFVVLAFSDQHVQHLVDLLRGNAVGDKVANIFTEFLENQKKQLHRSADTHIEQKTSTLQVLLAYVVSAMLLYFLLSLINSLAQRYHKRLYEQSKQKAS